jgi:hypothetical protein
MASTPPVRHGRTSSHLPDLYQRLQVTCWCEREVVWVHVEDVARGVTRSCWRAGCKRPSV